jgi:hypothetical protein
VNNHCFFIQDASDAVKSAMVSVVGLDSEKVQQLCDAANQEVPESEKVQIANYLCPVRFLWIWLLSTFGKILFLNFMINSYWN